MRKVFVASLILVIGAALAWWLFFRTPRTSTMALSDSASSSDNTVRIILESNYPPYTYIASDGTSNGYEIDIMSQICSDLGKKCEYEMQDWSKIIVSVERGQYDVGIGGISITEDRKKKVSFSLPYAFPYARFFGNLDEDPELKNVQTLSQLKSYFKGNDYVIGVQSGTTLDEFLGKEFTSIKVLRYEAISRMVMDLSYGRVNALFIETGTEGDFLSSIGDGKSNYGFFGPDIDGEYDSSFAGGIGMIVRKDAAELKEKINKSIEDLRSSGLLKKLSEKHFGYDISSRNSK